MQRLFYCFFSKRAWKPCAAAILPPSPRFALRYGGNRAKRAPTDIFRCFPAPSFTCDNVLYGCAEAKTPYLSVNTLHLDAKQPNFAPKSSVFTRFKPLSVLKPHSRWKMTQSRHYKLSRLCFTWNNIVGKCMRCNVNKRGVHKRKTPTNATNIKPLRNDVSRETLSSEEQPCSHARLRLLEPVRPPQHLILQAAFRKTQDTLCFTWNMPSTTTIWRNNTPDTVSRNRRRHNGEALLLVSRETRKIMFLGTPNAYLQHLMAKSL